MSRACDVVSASVCWVNKNVLTISVSLQMSVVNSVLTVAYVYKLIRDAEPDLLSYAEAARMHRAIGELPHPVENLTRNILFPALLLCRFSSRRQMRDVDVDMYRRFFRPVAWTAEASASALHNAENYMLRKAELHVAQLRRAHARDRKTLLSVHTRRFVATPHEERSEFMTRLRALYAEGYSVDDVSPPRTTTHLLLRATTTLNFRDVG